MADVKTLKLAVAGKLAAQSVDVQGFRDALAKFGTGFFRVVVRDRDAVDVAGGNYLPRRQNEAQASVQTSDIQGMEKYLLGRFAAAPQSLNDHADFGGLQGPFETAGPGTPGVDEVEIQVGNTWVNAKTGEVTQTGDSTPVSLKP